MRRWTGAFASGELPDETMKALRARIGHILSRHCVPPDKAEEVIRDLTDEVSFAFVGHNHMLEQPGAGRPANGPANLLSARVADILQKHGIRGNWLGAGTEEEDGQLGTVAELEAVALAALREACKIDKGVLARPA